MLKDCCGFSSVNIWNIKHMDMMLQDTVFFGVFLHCAFLPLEAANFYELVLYILACLYTTESCDVYFNVSD